MSDPVPRRAQLIQMRLEVETPYKGWSQYFPDEAYSEHSPTVLKVQVFEKYFASWAKLYNWTEIERMEFFTLDYKELIEDQVITEHLPDFATDMRDMPERMLCCMGLAMHQSITNYQKTQAAAVDEAEESLQNMAPPPAEDHKVPQIHARITNFASLIALKNLKANYYGKFVSLKGTVVRVGNIKPLCTKLGFQCASCGYIQAVNLPDGKYTAPKSCPSEGCKARIFNPQRSSSVTEVIDWQTIRIQEIMGEDQRDSGRIPRTVDCELTYDLVDSCVPGDVVTIAGIVKVNSIDEGRGQNKDKCMFLLYIHVNSIQNSKGNRRGGSGGEAKESGAGLAMDFSLKELYAIQEIQSQPDLYRLLVASLCPSIYGHEMVKAGLVLGLFGGTHKFVNDLNRIPVRGDPHILVVGDPGLGKSQMLQAVSSVAPRSVYVCGNTTTTSGLTVTLSKDGGGGDHGLEAGALVLADQGCCCIDEFDKMSNQHQALLEAMEQQSISIAKAGIVCSLPARASIIAAANPVGGHYNKSKTVAENLKMGSALLSRFDLVFILLDKPDEEMDCLLSDHVMALHGGQAGPSQLSGATVRREDLDISRQQWEADRPLSEKLRVPRGETLDLIPHQLMRKYVGYARKYVHSKVGPEAALVLQNFYLDLRRRHKLTDGTPITTRQLESLIRLTEARARLELREVATQEDAQNVIEIMKYSMVEVFSDQYGFLDFSRSQHGSGMSGRSKPKKFVAALQKVAERTYNSIFTVQQMREIAAEIGMQVMDFEGLITSLNNQGFLLKKGPKVYQLQTFAG